VEQNEGPYLIGAVDRALLLIGLLNDRRTVGVGEVAAELGVAPSTAHRLLATLCHRGFAVRDQHRLYHPGPELTGEDAAQASLPQLRRALRPLVEDTFERLGESVHLVVPAGSDVRFIDGMEGDQPLRIGLRTGVRMPAYCTSGGKAMLADLDWGEVEALHQRGLRPWPHARIRDLPALRRELAGVRRKGYGTNVEESEPGVTAVGVSIKAPSGRPVAALSVAVPTARFDRRAEPGLAAHLREVGTAAERALAAAR
jgi:IclR family transcriptional regulator, acetate operon repressor